MNIVVGFNKNNKFDQKVPKLLLPPVIRNEGKFIIVRQETVVRWWRQQSSTKKCYLELKIFINIVGPRLAPDE